MTPSEWIAIAAFCVSLLALVFSVLGRRSSRRWQTASKLLEIRDDYVAEKRRIELLEIEHPEQDFYSDKFALSGHFFERAKPLLDWKTVDDFNRLYINFACDLEEVEQSDDKAACFRDEWTSFLFKFEVEVEKRIQEMNR